MRLESRAPSAAWFRAAFGIPLHLKESLRALAAKPAMAADSCILQWAAPVLSQPGRSFRVRPFATGDGTMQIRDGIVEAIGNTPLIKLERASAATGCTILGKAEFMNPGQSVKDRAALFIIEDAVQKGLLRPGGVIVEGTAGNTGIGLAIVGNALGYRSVIV